ncbi:hypothetical protein Hanom_Chr07g00624351 [Helianthus anomalus]
MYIYAKYVRGGCVGSCVATIQTLFSLSLLPLVALDGGGDDFDPQTSLKFSKTLQIQERNHKLNSSSLSLFTNQLEHPPYHINFENLNLFMEIQAHSKVISRPFEGLKVIPRSFKQEPSFLSSF